MLFRSHKANYMIEKGIISKKYPYFNILLGSLGTSPLTPVSLASFIGLLPSGSVWALAGIGQYQLDANVAALSFGGNIRVGLEDNVYYDRSKKVLATNSMLVERAAKIIKLMGLEIASPSEARRMLNLK